MLMADGEEDFETVMDSIKFTKSSLPEIMGLSFHLTPSSPDRATMKCPVYVSNFIRFNLYNSM